MDLSFEGLLGLIGGILIVIGFPVWLFGDHFDPSKKPTKAGMGAAFITGLGILCISIPLLTVGSRILWSAIPGH